MDGEVEGLIWVKIRHISKWEHWAFSSLQSFMHGRVLFMWRHVLHNPTFSMFNYIKCLYWAASFPQGCRNLGVGGMEYLISIQWGYIFTFFKESESIKILNESSLKRMNSTITRVRKAVSMCVCTHLHVQERSKKKVTFFLFDIICSCVYHVWLSAHQHV